MGNLVGDPKRHKGARWLLAVFYTLLVLGGLTMIYPFWMMVTRSMSNSLDMRDRTLVPRYLVDRDELFLKFVVGRYADLPLLRFVYPVEGVTRPVDYRGRLKAPNDPPSEKLVRDWEEFIRTAADPSYLAVAERENVLPLYHAYLARRFEGSVERLNRTYHLMEDSFDLVDLPEWKLGRPFTAEAGPVFADYAAFLRTLPTRYLIPVSSDFIGPTAARCAEADWEAFLRAKYPGETIAATPLPYHAMDAALFIGNESSLRWEMATSNYKRVWDFLLHRGRALQNTVILVALAIFASLTLNPLAAYALSRFPGRHGRMTLLVMILTIAFPAEVAMIPSFLLLRDFNILNTYAAIILPGVVSGFSIFLLKGFFDGLPEELFESATIDGATELEIFWNVAVPLSRPILAVIALGTFTATYGGYMWALLVCQDSQMWTLMVWLFQFQMNFAASPWLGMTAFVIASLPTLLVFVFCQRIILRGIIIPTEK